MQQIGVWQNTLEFMCTWDLGRRCNLDCSYCPPHRHNNWSVHSAKEDLFSVAQLPLKYIDLYRRYSKSKVSTQINFTGGEPTLNPFLLELCHHLKNQDIQLGISVTTNGLFNKDYLEKLARAIDFATISFHFEAAEAAKKTIIENIFILKRKIEDPSCLIKGMNINVMVHAQNDLYLECVALVEKLIEEKIPYTLRFIGEHPGDKGAHKYTPEQIQFIRGGSSVSNKKNSSSCSREKKLGQTAGRPCCGGRSFKELNSSEIKSEKNDSVDLGWILKQEDRKKIENRMFKGWNCLVNLFFLHIQQETKEVFYHQTCQAREDGTRGPIGSTDDIESILQRLENTLSAETIKPIVCPNEVCNCGLCITKSKYPAVIQTFMNHNFKNIKVI